MMKFFVTEKALPGVQPSKGLYVLGILLPGMTTYGGTNCLHALKQDIKASCSFAFDRLLDFFLYSFHFSCLSLEVKTSHDTFPYLTISQALSLNKFLIR